MNLRRCFSIPRLRPKSIQTNVENLLHMAVTRLPRSFSQQPWFINWQSFCISRTLDQHRCLLRILGQNLQSAPLEKCNVKPELQSLDAHSTCLNMLERSSKVQFNQNAKQRLAASEANVKASNKGRRLLLLSKKTSTLPTMSTRMYTPNLRTHN